MKIIYLIKFFTALCIVGYDCSIGSKYTLLWVVLAVFYLILFSLAEIEDMLDKKLKIKENKN